MSRQSTTIVIVRICMFRLTCMNVCLGHARLLLHKLTLAGLFGESQYFMCNSHCTFALSGHLHIGAYTLSGGLHDTVQIMNRVYYTVAIWSILKFFTVSCQCSAEIWITHL